MNEHIVTFTGTGKSVQVPTGTLLVDAARMAGINILQPCGGQGRCGRCTVQVLEGAVRRRSSLRLSEQDGTAGYALACQSVVEGNLEVLIPPQETVERHLTMDRVAAEVSVPVSYAHRQNRTIQQIPLNLVPPSMDDQTDDISRLRNALRQQYGWEKVDVSLPVLQKISPALRVGDWEITAVVHVQANGNDGQDTVRLIDLYPAKQSLEEPLWGLAIDIGTTTVSVWLVDLISGKVRAQASDYNQQISRGEDVISRIIYASRVEENRIEMQQLVLETIRTQIDRVCRKVEGAAPERIVKATIAGNTTMIHLLLGIPSAGIRLAPFVPGVNEVPLLRARELGLGIYPEAVIDCLPGVASYVGSDITAGVLSSGLDDSDLLTLFMDVGTNGEIVLGSSDWLVTCACSAGPAFEGAGVMDGMRATTGAIEEVWIDSHTFEPSFRVIGGGKPRGICGSGLISLLGEAFVTGLIDKGGHINAHLNTPRVREGDHGLEFVVAWAEESGVNRDIVLSSVDIDNLLRAKAAIYAGYTVLAESVGVPMEGIEQMLIGGSFGKYINVEKAIQIGLLPDLPWEKIKFLGNTSVQGAYFALLNRDVREKIRQIAARMTYVELSADNSFYEAFMSALFLPHTELDRFPSVTAAMRSEIGQT